MSLLWGVVVGLRTGLTALVLATTVFLVFGWVFAGHQMGAATRPRGARRRAPLRASA